MDHVRKWWISYYDRTECTFDTMIIEVHPFTWQRDKTNATYYNLTGWKELSVEDLAIYNQ